MCGLSTQKYIDVNIEEFYYLYEKEENILKKRNSK